MSLLFRVNRFSHALLRKYNEICLNQLFMGVNSCSPFRDVVSIQHSQSRLFEKVVGVGKELICRGFTVHTVSVMVLHMY